MDEGPGFGLRLPFRYTPAPMVADQIYSHVSSPTYIAMVGLATLQHANSSIAARGGGGEMEALMFRGGGFDVYF